MMELLIVLAIISILAAIALPSYMHQRQRIAYADVVNSVQTLRKAAHTCMILNKNSDLCSTNRRIKNGALIAAILSVSGHDRMPSYGTWLKTVNSKNVGHVAVLAYGNKNEIYVEAMDKEGVQYTLRGNLNASGNNVKWVIDSRYSTCLAKKLCDPM